MPQRDATDGEQEKSMKVLNKKRSAVLYSADVTDLSKYQQGQDTRANRTRHTSLELKHKTARTRNRTNERTPGHPRRARGPAWSRGYSRIMFGVWTQRQCMCMCMYMYRCVLCDLVRGKKENFHDRLVCLVGGTSTTVRKSLVGRGWRAI
jgi:hypothetical protein